MLLLLLGCNRQPGQEFRGHLVEFGNDLGFIQCGRTDTLLIVYEATSSARATIWVERGSDTQDSAAAAPPRQNPSLPYAVLLGERADTTLRTFRIVSVRDSTPADCR